MSLAVEAAEASNVSATSEEQSSSISSVGQNAEQLSSAAMDLFELVAVRDAESARGTVASPPQEGSAPDGGFDRAEKR